MKILSLLIIIIGFFQCSTLKLEDNPPFKITSAVSKNWIGGQPGVKGVNVKITYTAKETIEFDSIYFSEKVAKAEVNNTDKIKMIIGHFNTSTRKNDIVLDFDSKKEINNSVPSIESFPFKLKENEAVITYKIKGKTKYFKVKSIVKGETSFYQ